MKSRPRRETPIPSRVVMRILAMLALSGMLGARSSAVHAQVSALEPRGEGADVVLVRDAWLAFEPLTLEELLQHVPGIVVSRRGGAGSRVALHVAGSPTGRVRVVIDGIVYDEPEFAWARLVDVPLVAIERIELHRFTDPARIEVWTRPPPSRAPVSEIELARGGFDTRTRRVQLQTPRRSWWVSGRYDEVLRGVHDFRAQREGTLPAQIGTYNGRHRGFDVGFERKEDERLRYRYEEFIDNTHGSAASRFSSEGARRVLNALRWGRRMGASHWTLDVSYLSWSRRRNESAKPDTVDDARGALALDVDVPYGDGHRHSLRLRASDHEARTPGTFVQYQTYDFELQTRRRASALWNAWIGAHRHEHFGNQWSARLHARWERDAWAWEAQVGRGVSWPGWGETVAGDARPGRFASLGVSRSGAWSSWQLTGFVKDLKVGITTPHVFFPTLGRGSRRVGGATLSAGWRWAERRAAPELGASATWLPWAEGDRGGQPHLQSELHVRWTRLDFFEGDLVLTLQNVWHFETRRRFTNAVALPAHAAGDVRVHLRVLRRMLFFWNVLNVADVRYETQPGVRVPERRSLYGVRVQLID